jgi:hypothetical protein
VASIQWSLLNRSVSDLSCAKCVVKCRSGSDSLYRRSFWKHRGLWRYLSLSPEMGTTRESSSTGVVSERSNRLGRTITFVVG